MKRQSEATLKEATLIVLLTELDASVAAAAQETGMAESSVRVKLSHLRKRYGADLERFPAEELEHARRNLGDRYVRAKVWLDDAFTAAHGGTAYEGALDWARHVSATMSEDALRDQLSDVKRYSRADLMQLLGLLLRERLSEAGYDVYSKEGLCALAEKIPMVQSPERTLPEDEHETMPYDWRLVRSWLFGHNRISEDAFQAILYLTRPQREEEGRRPIGVATEAVYEAMATDHREEWKNAMMQLSERLAPQIHACTSQNGINGMAEWLATVEPEFSSGTWRLFLRGDSVTAGDDNRSALDGLLRQLDGLHGLIAPDMRDWIRATGEELMGKHPGGVGNHRRIYALYDSELEMTAKLRFDAANLGRGRGKGISCEEIARQLQARSPSYAGMEPKALAAMVSRRIAGSAAMDYPLAQVLDEIFVQYLEASDCNPPLATLYRAERGQAVSDEHAPTTTAHSFAVHSALTAQRERGGGDLKI